MKNCALRSTPWQNILAAMHLVEENGSNEDKWCVFIDAVSAGQKLSGRRPEFLMTIRECRMVENSKNHLSGFISEKLTRLINPS